MGAMKHQRVTVEKFYTDQQGHLELRLAAGAGGLKRIIREPTVNRPGLAISGFTRSMSAFPAPPSASGMTSAVFAGRFVMRALPTWYCWV